MQLFVAMKLYPYTFLKKFKRFSEGCKELQDDPQGGSCQLLEMHE
jgi:hypothetical protein